MIASALSGAVVQIITLGLLAVWGGLAFGICDSHNFFRLWTIERETPPRVLGSNVLIAFALYLVSHILVVLIFTLVPLTPNADPQAIERWGQVIGSVVLGLLLFALWATIDRTERWRIFSWAVPSQSFRDFGMGAVSWLLAFPVTTLTGQLLHVVLRYLLPSEEGEQVAVRELHKSFGDTPLLIAHVACIVILVPIIEELLFRGLLLGWLRQKCGQIWAIFLSAALFSGFHYSQSQGIIGNIALVIPLFLLGSFLGFIYLKRRSLWAPIGLHVVYNGFGSLFLIGSWTVEAGG